MMKMYHYQIMGSKAMNQDKLNIKEALNEQGGFHVWWRLLRPHTLTASFVLVFVGTMFAFIENNTFHTALFVAMMLAAIIIQEAKNMFNEYYEFKRWLDKEDSLGIGHTFVSDCVSPQIILPLTFLYFRIAIILGVYIAASTSWWIVAIGACCMF